MSVSRANSSRIRLEAPEAVAAKITEGFQQRDPLLAMFLEDIELLRVEGVMPGSERGPSNRTTDISEKGLETLIMRHMTGIDGLAVAPGIVADAPDPAGHGYFASSPKDYDRAQSLDVTQLFGFLQATQPESPSCRAEE